MIAFRLTPTPQQMTRAGGCCPLPDTVAVAASGYPDFAESAAWELLASDLPGRTSRRLCLIDDPAAAHVRLHVDPQTPALHKEGYLLAVSPEGVDIRSRDRRGLFYGIHTLNQLSATTPETDALPICTITDYPTHTQRWLMPDLGRAPFSLPLLKRLVRLAARLKYNGLHLHLNDNELNPVVYDGLPLGRENPSALPLSAYAELIAYAARYHVAIIPEVESWGHAGSVLQHYPELYGATRLHGRGHSFGIGPATLELLGELYAQWFAILPTGSHFHVGLDEANWRRLPGADPKRFCRERLIALFYELVHERAKAVDKEIQLVIWDGNPNHTKMPIPPEIRDHIITEPWNYRDLSAISRQVAHYFVRPHKQFGPNGQLRLPFMCGAGGCYTQAHGGARATTEWAYASRNMPNCLGVDVTLWGVNNLMDRLVTIHAGANAAWNPVSAWAGWQEDTEADGHLGVLAAYARSWQARLPDADPQAWRDEMGPEVAMGCYQWGERYQQPVAPIWMPERPYLGDSGDEDDEP